MCWQLSTGQNVGAEYCDPAAQRQRVTWLSPVTKNHLPGETPEVDTTDVEQRKRVFDRLHETFTAPLHATVKLPVVYH